MTELESNRGRNREHTDESESNRETAAAVVRDRSPHPLDGVLRTYRGSDSCTSVDNFFIHEDHFPAQTAAAGYVPLERQQSR